MMPGYSKSWFVLRMPMRSMTARDLRFPTAVKDTISESDSRSKATRSAARAASVAKPLPQNWRAKRQPTSTHGEKENVRRGTDRPVKPMNSLDSRSSTAQLLQP